MLNPSGTQAYTINVVSPGATRKRLAPEFSWVSTPVWSPDGRYLMFLGARLGGNQLQTGLWVIPRDDGVAEQVQLDLVSLSPELRQASLDGWLPGDRILVELEIRGRTHLWQARLRRKPWRADRVEQITFGTGAAKSPSVAADGTMVVSNEESDLDLWSLPFDATRGKVTGEPQRLTQDVAREAFPSISTDGAKLAYSAEQAGASHIWIMDLPSRTKRMLTSSAAWDFRPAISMDGTQVAYSSGNLSTSGKLYRIPASGGTAEKVGETGSIIWDWSADGRDLLTLSQTTPFGVDLIDVSAKRVIPFVRRVHSVFQAHISHDGHWAIAQEGVGVLITRFDASQPAKLDWRPLGLKGGDLFRWSPDDDVIYFLSNRDSFRCVWGQHLDAGSKQLRGEPFPVAHFHEARHSLRVFDSGEIGLAVARDKIVIAEAEKVGNVWTTRLPQ
jgi:Tol biopolymer transport system component